MADPSSRTGARYADAAILNYVDGLHAPHDAALQAAYTAPEQGELQAIHLGPNEARLLEVLLGLVAARKVVEVGTLAGYSALRIARALPQDGHLWTLDNDPAAVKEARSRMAEAGLSDRVSCVLGEARELLPDLLEREGPLDAMFLDADKRGYESYGQMAAEHIRPGGLLIADNVFLFGKLMQDTETAQAMRAFHEQAARNFHTACIPTPDGLLIGVRRQ